MTGQNGEAAANPWQFAEVLAAGAARRFRWETVLPLLVAPLLFPRLLCPGQRGAVARIQNRHGRPLAAINQPLEKLGRRTAQPQLPTDVPLRPPNGDGKVAIRPNSPETLRHRQSQARPIARRTWVSCAWPSLGRSLAGGLIFGGGALHRVEGARPLGRTRRHGRAGAHPARSAYCGTSGHSAHLTRRGGDDGLRSAGSRATDHTPKGHASGDTSEHCNPERHKCFDRVKNSVTAT